MSSTDSILIPHPGNVTLPFWPAGRTRLIIVFEILDNGVVAHGLDPDIDALVFKASLRAEQQVAFVAAVATGVAGVAVDGSGGNPSTNTVVVGGPGPGDGTGPKYRVTLAATTSQIARAAGIGR